MDQDDLVMDRFDSGLEDDSSDPDNDEENNEEQGADFLRNANASIVEEEVTEAYAADMHSYLGSELEVVRGRTVYDEGSIITLDMLQPSDLVLVPGQTLPLTVFDLPTITMLRNCLQNDRTFGVIASWSDGGITIINKFGTTAEIYEYLPREGPVGFRVKAKIRQRFRLVDTIADYHMSPWKARVQILPEVQLSDPLTSVRLTSLNHLRSSAPRTQHYSCRRMDSALTRWPVFVYNQYDIERLKTGIKKELASSFTQDQNDEEKRIHKIVIPDDPTELSFWVAQNMPMKEGQKVMLLKLNSPIQRLRWELQSLQQRNRSLCCQYCSNMIGLHTDIFAMSAEGPQSTYVNPGGYLHETITLYKVKGVFSIGPPSTEFSWFPGYAWSICRCKNCKQQMGWKFTATKSHMKPSKFWGICRRSITVTTQRAPDDDNKLLVF